MKPVVLLFLKEMEVLQDSLSCVTTKLDDAVGVLDKIECSIGNHDVCIRDEALITGLDSVLTDENIPA